MKEQTAESIAFDNAINNFLNNIESLRYSLPTITNILQVQTRKNLDEHTTFLKSECEYLEDKKQYVITPEKNRKNIKLRKAAINSILSKKIVSRNFVVSLVSQFDTYIGQLMKCVFEVKSEIINNSERQLSFSELQTFENIEDARNYIVEKEIESVLRESHSEQFKWFEKKLDVKLTKDLPAWKSFIEITQRRNLFVHNDGKVNSQYLNVCKQNGIDVSALKIGEELKSDIEYFENAFNCLFEIGFKLNQVLRRKLLPENLESADYSLLNITFELIQNKQYKLSKVLYEFENKYIKKYSNQDFELRLLLNRAQTHKWLGEEDLCKNIIKSKDWSASGSLFQLASSVLLDDFNKAADAMKMIGDNQKVIDKSHYNDWPIFKEFVKSEEFETAYTEIYGQEPKVMQNEKVTEEEGISN